MARRNEEEKMLFDPYISVSTIQRRFSLSRVDASDIFAKAQDLDEQQGFYKIYNDRVRTEAVYELLGLDFNKDLERYKVRKNYD